MMKLFAACEESTVQGASLFDAIAPEMSVVL